MFTQLINLDVMCEKSCFNCYNEFTYGIIRMLNHSGGKCYPNTKCQAGRKYNILI